MVLKLCVVLSLASLYIGASSRAEDPDDLRELVRKSVTICGDDDLWDDITKHTSVQGIKGIDWFGKNATMKNFISIHENLVESKDAIIKVLKEKIAALSGEVGSDMISTQDIQFLVEQAVEDEETFETKLFAINSRCGKPGEYADDQQKRIPNPDAFENAVEKIRKVAEGWFTSQKHSEVAEFTLRCEDHLGFQRSNDALKDDLASYCDELCAEMAEEVQMVSNKMSVGQSSNLRELQNSLNNEEVRRQALVSTQKECENAMSTINRFHDYMKKLAQDYSDKFKAFHKAEWALAAATDIWKKLTGNLLAQKEAMQKALEGLTDLGQKEQDLGQKMQIAQGKLTDGRDALQTATDEWNRLSADLVAVRAAANYADEVKEKLSLLLRGMDDYVEECVREPVRNIGLSEMTEVYGNEFFPWDVKTLPAKQDMKNALTAFHDYCEQIAKGIFKTVKESGHVDLSPLCELGNQDDTLQEIVTTIQARKDSVAGAIQNVQTWLNPFKGLRPEVTEETEQSEYVAYGEPFGLRRVMNLRLEQFYNTYLKKWKKGEEFLQLLDSVMVAVNDLDRKVNDAANHMTEVAAQVQGAEDALEDATAVFKEAQQQHTLEKQELTDSVQILEEQLKQANTNLEALKARVEEARRQWKLSKQTLLDQHAKARASFLQSSRTILK